MLRTVLRDNQWQRIANFLPGKAIDYGVTAKHNRLFVEAVLRIVRPGSAWRDLPGYFGYWQRIDVRYHRWSKKRLWQRVFKALADDPDLDYWMVDGSSVRVHQHGAAKKTNKLVSQKERHFVERLFQKLKHYRRIATRYER